MPEPGILYLGENLEVLRDHVVTASVDLVYLDPPFNSGATYEMLSAKEPATESRSAGIAFSDVWRWDDQADAAYVETQSGEAPRQVAVTVRALREILGPNDMMAYVVMLAPRLVELRRVLKKTGSIYLHCDPNASHYLKVLMDSVFGARNFRREIVWRSGWVSGFKAKANNWCRNHDVLLYFVRDLATGFTFNKELAYKPHPPGYERRGGGGNSLGVAIDDVWNEPDDQWPEDVWDEVELYSPWIKSFSKEKLGYMTQKPLALMERIVSVSSDEGDLVLDPFAGGGTTLAACQKLGRSWIGIDSSPVAIEVTEGRLQQVFGDDVAYELIGGPGARSARPAGRPKLQAPG